MRQMSPKGGSHTEVREPLSAEIHQLHEAHQLKKGGGRPDRAPSLEEPSLAFR
jgi:hypothetical protein